MGENIREYLHTGCEEMIYNHEAAYKEFLTSELILTCDKLYLEWAKFTDARNEREQNARHEIESVLILLEHLDKEGTVASIRERLISARDFMHTSDEQRRRNDLRR